MLRPFAVELKQQADGNWVFLCLCSARVELGEHCDWSKATNHTQLAHTSLRTALAQWLSDELDGSTPVVATGAPPPDVKQAQLVALTCQNQQLEACVGNLKSEVQHLARLVARPGPATDLATRSDAVSDLHDVLSLSSQLKDRERNALARVDYLEGTVLGLSSTLTRMILPSNFSFEAQLLNSMQSANSDSALLGFITTTLRNAACSTPFGRRYPDSAVRSRRTDK